MLLVLAYEVHVAHGVCCNQLCENLGGVCFSGDGPSNCCCDSVITSASGLNSYCSDSNQAGCDRYCSSDDNGSTKIIGCATAYIVYAILLVFF